MREIVMQCAKVLWDFTRLNQIPIKSDVMIVLGNDDPRTAHYAADLFLEGWSPLVLITGKDGSGTKGKLPHNRTEAEIFQDLMIAKGVPKSCILLETEATNTGENMRLSQALLRRHDISPDKVMLVTKSLMELRAALTFKKQWQGAQNAPSYQEMGEPSYNIYVPSSVRRLATMTLHSSLLSALRLMPPYVR
ncbi:DUF218 domain [Elysia marginata]|uniref:DUF218 domain n=1 Tax=Elysia marginata TaxID=1093978 RepID=A0AAV4F8Q3_9GAST|nr:DUF218 domain [Elysia marginata]